MSTSGIPEEQNEAFENATMMWMYKNRHRDPRSPYETIAPNRLNLGLPPPGCALQMEAHSMPPWLDENIVTLQLCSACKAIKYCGRDHQKQHRAAHKLSCNTIKDMKASLARETAALEARGNDNPLNDNEVVGRFYTLGNTRPYMQAQFDVATAYLNIRTGEAVEGALNHFREMLRLNNGDNQGVRGYIPAQYLRLGRDQECFDFIKWWRTIGSRSGYEWGNPDEPFLNLSGEDAFELTEELSKPTEFDLSHLVAITLIKMRLLTDLRTLQKDVNKLGALCPEDKTIVAQEHCMTDVMIARKDIINRADYADLITEMSRQVRVMYKAVNDANKFFWPGILNPSLYSHQTPGMYVAGSKEEVVLTFRQAWYSWAECPPAIEMVKKLSRGRAP